MKNLGKASTPTQTNQRIQAAQKSQENNTASAKLMRRKPTAVGLRIVTESYDPLVEVIANMKIK